MGIDVLVAIDEPDRSAPEIAIPGTTD